jgi:hypothetical protein
MFELDNWDKAVSTIRARLEANPEIRSKAGDLAGTYVGKRGLMVVDVVGSMRRKYKEYVVPKLLPSYVEKAADLSLATLASTPPVWMKLKTGEAGVMTLVARGLIAHGKANGLVSEDEICNHWAASGNYGSEIIDIKGIGPALHEYLRMLCGADTLKVDVRVINGLKGLGINADLFTADGLLEVCKALAADIGCTLIELDQILWHLFGNKDKS